MGSETPERVRRSSRAGARVHRRTHMWQRNTPKRSTKHTPPTIHSLPATYTNMPQQQYHATMSRYFNSGVQPPATLLANTHGYTTYVAGNAGHSVIMQGAMLDLHLAPQPARVDSSGWWLTLWSRASTKWLPTQTADTWQAVQSS